MIISPPFLPARGATQAEDAWLDSAMSQPPSRLPSTEALEGSFPLSYSLAWHNGIHIQAPQADGAVLPVRAIADGTVLFVKKPEPANADPNHGQNYNPFARQGAVQPAWTDNGCVIIEHKTDIGAAGSTATQVVYYSLYMHLSKLGKAAPGGKGAAQEWKAGDAIWRKDEVGLAGQIYGSSHQIHFEISCDAANLKHLIGREPNWVEPATAPATLPAPAADGRIDCNFGSLYFYLPANTPTDAGTTLPKNHLRRAGGSTLGTPVWVKLTYEKGDCSLQTFDERGAAIGAVQPEAEGEYNLYEAANTRHNSLSATDKAHSSPSGWYELLRFGRNIGRGPAATDKDPLPSAAAHWRRITGPTGQPMWADLNASGSLKFSDADFLPVMGWNCVKDDPTPNDQRCDSVNLKNLIRDPDAANTKRMEIAELAKRLGHKDLLPKLRRTLCKFPSEWDRTTIASRYEFVKELASFKQSAGAWEKLEAHMQAIAFDGLPAEYKNADWRWHPREFVQMWRCCGWLSVKEISQIYENTDEALIKKYSTAFNGMCSKYMFNNKKILAHLFGQGAIESASLKSMQERAMFGAVINGQVRGTKINPASTANEQTYGHWWGQEPSEMVDWFSYTQVNSKGHVICSSYDNRMGNQGRPDGQKFRGRGFKQLTGRDNYVGYWKFRGWIPNTSNQVDNPHIVAVDPSNCMDSGGWYLTFQRPTVRRTMAKDMNCLAESNVQKKTEELVSKSVTRAINGGEIDWEGRLRETRKAKRVLMDF